MTQPSQNNNLYFAHRGVNLQAKEIVDALAVQLGWRTGATLKTIADESSPDAIVRGGVIAQPIRSAVAALIHAMESKVNELHALEEYWHGLPWDEALGVDLRQNQTETPSAEPAANLFSPELLEDKKVADIKILNDVRDTAPADAPTAKFEVFGDPVIWLTSRDGTSVAVPKNELGRLVSVLAGVLGNMDSMKPADDDNGQ